MQSRRGALRLATWEAGTVLWVCLASSALHFAFELSDYWLPMALFAAVNESAWEHTKIIFWPGLVAALVQYTYTRDVARNYWAGKATALTLTPVLVLLGYYAYMAWTKTSGATASLPKMLVIMVLGVCTAHAASWFMLTRAQYGPTPARMGVAAMAVLTAVFASFSYYPPRVFLFENYYCYEYTGEYGILADYAPYRVFVKVDEDGGAVRGRGLNYCDPPPAAGEDATASDKSGPQPARS